MHVAPSNQSGGVPEPSDAYVLRASLAPVTLPAARHILVVMDLNGTLLHRPNRNSPTRFVERPYAREFLRYCVDTFKVVVWSSARPANVTRMCNRLLAPEVIAESVVAVWGRNRFGLTQADYEAKVQCYKRLTTVWDSPIVQASHPHAAEGGHWDQSNTVLVDDSLEKARSEPFNCIQVPEFAGDVAEPGFILPQVHDYLNSLCLQGDISAYMHKHPFLVQPDFGLQRETA
jgi:hypothetical protein